MVKGLKKVYKEYRKYYMDVVFIYILILEYRDMNLMIVGEWMREVSMVLVYNLGFYGVLVEEGVMMVSCG